MEFISLNLVAKNRNEELIKHYLEEHASPDLARKINEGVQITKKDGDKVVTLINKKTLSGFWAFATSEAKKRAQGGCVAIEDEVVFGWAIHYFEEESIEGNLYNLDGSRYDRKPEKKEQPVKESSKKSAETPKPLGGQISLFDALAADTASDENKQTAEDADNDGEGNGKDEDIE